MKINFWVALIAIVIVVTVAGLIYQLKVLKTAEKLSTNTNNFKGNTSDVEQPYSPTVGEQIGYEFGGLFGGYDTNWDSTGNGDVPDMFDFG